MKIFDIFPFFGAISAIDARSTPKGAATDHLNMREEDGTLKFRYGYRNLSSPQSGFSAVFGQTYLQGYSSTTEKEEYVTFETVSGNTRAYSRPADDGDPPTEITNAGVSVNLNASEWVANVFDGFAYCINPLNTAPVLRHEIGTINSLTPIVTPTDPTVEPTYRLSYGGDSTPYTQLGFAGIDVSTEIVYTGGAHATDSSVESDGSLIIGHASGASNEVASSIEIDLNGASAGIQDYTYNDKFAFTFSTIDRGFRVGSDIRPRFINNDGSPKTLIPDQVKVALTVTGNVYEYVVQFGWSDKTRADFDNVRKLRIEYTVADTDGTNDNRLKVSPVWEGGIDMTQPASNREPGTGGLNLAYSYYFSTPGLESGLSPVLFIPNSRLTGYSPGQGILPLGVQVEITMTVSGDSNVDNFRIYVKDNVTGDWKRLATQADSDATYDVRLNRTEITRLTTFTPSPFIFANVTNAFPFKGHMVWLYRGGSGNIRYSRNGEPLKLASDEDPDDDLAAGETFTLADNFGDEPLGGLQAGDAAMIAGRYGVYVQLGDRAVEMTPTRKVAGSSGVAGKYAFTRFKDDSGVVGIAYLTPTGQVLFSIPGAFVGKEIGDTVNLTNLVRDGELSPKDFLLDEQSAFSLTDYSQAQVYVDERQDALCVSLGNRTMVLRRANLLDGARYWEHYQYNTGGSTVSTRYMNGSGKRGLRGIRSNGNFDEYEYNSSTGAFIEGTARDGGNTPVDAYWESKKFTHQNSRVNRVKVYRSTYTNTPSVTVYSTRTPAGTTKTLTSGEKSVRFKQTDQGEEISYRITMPEGTSPVGRLEVELFAAGRRVNG